MLPSNFSLVGSETVQFDTASSFTVLSFSLTKTSLLSLILFFLFNVTLFPPIILHMLAMYMVLGAG